LDYLILSIKFNPRLAVAISRQFSANEVGLLNDLSKACSQPEGLGLAVSVNIASLQTHDCRIKLAAAGEH
jgi:hypothetical protein